MAPSLSQGLQTCKSGAGVSIIQRQFNEVLEGINGISIQGIIKIMYKWEFPVKTYVTSIIHFLLTSFLITTLDELGECKEFVASLYMPINLIVSYTAVSDRGPALFSRMLKFFLYSASRIPSY